MLPPVSIIKMIAAFFPFIEADVSKTEHILEACFIEGKVEKCSEIKDYFEDIDMDEEFFQQFLQMGKRRDCHKESTEFSKNTCKENDNSCKKKRYEEQHERCEQSNREERQLDKETSKGWQETAKEVAKEVVRRNKK